MNDKRIRDWEVSGKSGKSWNMGLCRGPIQPRQCDLELQQACRESALPYRTVARWVIAFTERRQNVADMYRPGRSSISDVEAHADVALIDSYRRQMIRELARQTGFAHTTVLQILK
ncbi:HTH_48 domain-containing protein [Trichonephila clavipes]|nr:HTH_48 domain-containing protein [Trichonephila clavipes]